MGWFRKKLNTLFSRTFMGMLIIALTVLMAVAALFMIYFRKEMLGDYHQLTYTTLGNIDAAFSQIVTDQKRAAAEWSDSAEGTVFRIEEPDPVEHMKFVKQLYNELIRSSYMHSIYFINKEKKITLYLCCSQGQTEDLDEILIEKLSEQTMRNQPFVWSVPKRYDIEKEIPILTIPIADTLIGEDKFNGMVVFNLSLEALRNTLLADNIEEDFQIIMFDSNGMVISHSNKELIGENWSDKEWVQQVIHGKTQFQSKDNETKWEFCVLGSEVPGFYLVAQSDYAAQYININYIVYITLTISIVAGGAITLMMLFFSRRIFAPFTNMVGNLKQSNMGAEIEKEIDEIAFLEHFYQGVSSKMEVMNDKREKDFIVKNLLLGNLKDDITQMMKQKEIISEKHPFYMLLVSVNNRDKNKSYNMQEYDMSRNMVSSVFSSALEKYGYTTYFEVGLRRMLFIVSKEEGVELNDQIMMNAIDLVEASVQKISQIQIYAVLSGMIWIKEYDCVECFKTLDEHLKTRQVLEKEGSILLSEKAECLDNGYVEQLIECIQEKDKSKYMQTVDTFIEAYSILPFHEFVEKTEKIIREVMKATKIHKSSNYIIGNEKDIKDRIYAVTDRAELDLWMESIYDEAVILFNRNSNNATAVMMEMAIDYIRNNYDDSNLNVNMLADRVGISAAYFGKLFTEFTGVRTLDYILKIRMERAHDILLSEVNKDIADIAESVGYSNSTYFTTAFKKYYGMTPSRFREYYLISGKELE